MRWSALLAQADEEEKLRRKALRERPTEPHEEAIQLSQSSMILSKAAITRLVWPFAIG